MYYLKTSASFDSAHFLQGYEGKCANIHGHHWMIEVKIAGESLQDTGTKRGMLIDFGDLKKAVRELADSYDHALIYEEDSLKPATVAALKSENFHLIPIKFRPTAENFARCFYETLHNKAFPVSSVTVYETPDNCAVYEV
ncbi:MAG: 6-carboxytetrahydropterin synthase QueD [Clostridiales bacterium]|nr:6-carboxytetrahydropterin synthase QueD [Clostridiales bacterium]